MQQVVAQSISNIDELAMYLRIGKSGLSKLCPEGLQIEPLQGCVPAFRRNY